MEFIFSDNDTLNYSVASYNRVKIIENTIDTLYLTLLD